MPDHATPDTDLKSLVVQWVAVHLGPWGTIALAVVFAAAAVWWNWDKIRALPGIAHLLKKQEKPSPPPTPLPARDPDRFAVAVAHFENDTNEEQEHLIVESLVDFGMVQTLRFDRIITQQGGDVQKAIEAGHEQARALLAQSGADVLIWGSVLRSGDKVMPRLRWTTSSRLPLENRSRRYTVTEELELPHLFVDDLTDLLDLLVLTNGDYVSPAQSYTRGPVPEFIQRVDKLLASQSAQWPRSAASSLSLSFADFCLVYGTQDWKNDGWLRKAEDWYSSGLPQPGEDWIPHGYVNALFNLALTYSMRAARLDDAALYKKAIPLFETVVKLCSDGRDNWLESYANLHLGHAIRLLGTLEKGTNLEEAVDAYAKASTGINESHNPDLYKSLLFGRTEVLRMIAAQKGDPSS